jgi:hypothetical protein
MCLKLSTSQTLASANNIIDVNNTNNNDIKNDINNNSTPERKLRHNTNQRLRRYYNKNSNGKTNSNDHGNNHHQTTMIYAPVIGGTSSNRRGLTSNKTMSKRYHHASKSRGQSQSSIFLSSSKSTLTSKRRIKEKNKNNKKKNREVEGTGSGGATTKQNKNKNGTERAGGNNKDGGKQDKDKQGKEGKEGGDNNKKNKPTPMPSFPPSSNPTVDPTPNPTKAPTPNPTKAPTPRPTSSPTFHPTTASPTIKKGNPTPSPTKWVDSWVGDQLKLSLSTLSADEDQLAFETDIEARMRERMRRIQSTSRTSDDRVYERISAEDVNAGKHTDLVQTILTVVADVMCKYTEFVILSKHPNPTEDDFTEQFVDHCKGDDEIVDIESFYTNRDTVIIVPVDGTDFTHLTATDHKVFEGSIVGKYLHWIQWDISCPIVQISKTILNEKQQNVDKALESIRADARLVMDETTSGSDVSEILMSKNNQILSVSKNGWEVVKSIEYMKPRKKKRDEEYGGAITDDESGDDEKIETAGSGFFQPIRITGFILMSVLFAFLTLLIKVGRKRDDKVWEAKKNSPMDGDLVSYEGVNFLLENSRALQVSPQKDGDASGNTSNTTIGKNNNTETKIKESAQLLTEKSSSAFGTNDNDTQPTVEHITTGGKNGAFFRKTKSVTQLLVTPNEIEVEPSQDFSARQRTNFFTNNNSTTSPTSWDFTRVKDTLVRGKAGVGNGANSDQENEVSIAINPKRFR